MNWMLKNLILMASGGDAVKIPETFTDKTQDAICSGNCIMGMTMKTQIWVNPDTQVFLFIS